MKRMSKTTVIMSAVLFIGIIICWKTYTNTKKDMDKFDNTTEYTSD